MSKLPAFLPRSARFVIWIIAVGVFSTVVLSQFNESNIGQQIFRTNLLIVQIADGFQVQVGNRVGTVIGDETGMCGGYPCKFLKLSLDTEKEVHLLVDGKNSTEIWLLKADIDGSKIARTNGSWVVAADNSK